MQFTILMLAMLQVASARGDRFQIAVPQGWKTLLNVSEDVLLQHSTGASLLVRRITYTRNLADYAQHQAERVMSPLGFAKLSEPRTFKDTHDEWVEYEISGNRLSDHRRLLYRVLRRGTGYFEIVFEAPEDKFDILTSEAQSIASSIQVSIQAPPAARRRVAPAR